MALELYNPMTGHRLDLDVDKEDGAAAEKTHKRWKAKRIAYLEELSESCSDEARASYGRELAELRGQR